MSLQVVTSFARRVAADLGERRPARRDLDFHLREAEGWLARAHDAGGDGGVSYGWSLRGGWRPSYRETSGYILTTFFNLAALRERPEWRERALRIARWLVSVQNADGSISNPRYGPGGIVFDTGQVLFGLVRAWRETQDLAFLSAARRAGQWLVEVADGDRRWTRHEHFGTPHVYNSRTAWALLQLDRVSPDADLVAVARANLDWALAEQRDGWFRHCAFKPGVPPYTHTIAYAIRGLLESGRLLDDERYVRGGAAAALAVRGLLREDGFLPGQVDEEGRPRATYCCLTGNCQLAICWAKLYESTGDESWKRAAIQALDYVISRQDVETRDQDVRGAIAGSYPIWGRYAPLSYPNWATKFFVDAMHLRMRWPA